LDEERDVLTRRSAASPLPPVDPLGVRRHRPQCAGCRRGTRPAEIAAELPQFPRRTRVLTDYVVELERVELAFLVSTDTVAQVVEELAQLRFVVARHKLDVVSALGAISSARATSGILSAIGQVHATT
jgi:hypothetical protein